MLQVFYIDIAKVDQGCCICWMVVHICCKDVLPMFHMSFQTYVANVFIWMLHMFHTYVACVLSGCCVCLQRFSSVLSCFSKCFRTMLQVCISNVSVIFRHMLQVFYLNIAYVAVATHICCKSTYSKCFIYFRHMLQQVLYIASVSWGTGDPSDAGGPHGVGECRGGTAGRVDAGTQHGVGEQQQGGHACSDARPWVGATGGSAWETQPPDVSPVVEVGAL
jgi:hypothetical protein